MTYSELGIRIQETALGKTLFKIGHLSTFFILAVQLHCKIVDINQLPFINPFYFASKNIVNIQEALRYIH